MGNPFKPTKRVRFLLGRVKLGRYQGTKYLKNNRRYYHDIGATYGSGIRNAMESEILHMLAFNLVEEVRTPGHHDTVDTSEKPARLIGEGYKLVLTAAGKRIADEDALAVA